jgi:hypothetical protein
MSSLAEFTAGVLLGRRGIYLFGCSIGIATTFCSATLAEICRRTFLWPEKILTFLRDHPIYLRILRPLFQFH